MDKNGSEWAVVFARRPWEIHRGPMTEDAAREWIREAVEEDGFKPGVFALLHRSVGEWKTLGVSDDDEG